MPNRTHPCTTSRLLCQHVPAEACPVFLVHPQPRHAQHSQCEPSRPTWCSEFQHANAWCFWHMLTWACPVLFWWVPAQYSQYTHIWTYPVLSAPTNPSLPNALLSWHVPAYLGCMVITHQSTPLLLFCFHGCPHIQAHSMLLVHAKPGLAGALQMKNC